MIAWMRRFFYCLRNPARQPTDTYDETITILRVNRRAANKKTRKLRHFPVNGDLTPDQLIKIANEDE